MKLLNTSIFPYPYIKLIVNNYFTSFHIVCEKPHDNVLAYEEDKDVDFLRDGYIYLNSHVAHP